MASAFCRGYLCKTRRNRGKNEVRFWVCPLEFTIDAAGCQKAIMRQIVRDCKADAVLALKDNQRAFHEEMLLLFEKELKSSPHLFAKHEAPAEKNSGRIERRSPGLHSQGPCHLLRVSSNA